MADSHPPTPDHPEFPDYQEPPPPARLTRGTLLGCLGILCVLLTLPLLWLAVGVGGGALARALPIVAFALAIAGAALAFRVPAGAPRPAANPERPLTRHGDAPVVERPATRANRLSLVVTGGLTLCALSGFTIETIAASARTPAGPPWGLLVMLLAGVGLLAQGALVGMSRAPTPAWRWLRLSIYGAAGRQSAFLLAGGFVATAGALFLILLDGFLIGALGLALLVMAMVVITPLSRRAPRWQGPRPPRRGAPSRNP